MLTAIYQLLIYKLTCGSLLREATPPPPRDSFITKLNAFIPGSLYLKCTKKHKIILKIYANILCQKMKLSLNKINTNKQELHFSSCNLF